MIEFRAWDKESKTMRWVEALNFYQEEYSWINDDYREMEQSWEDDNIEDAILMQSTGLKDKYGVEIYESDIVVNHVGDEWVITYFRGAFRYYPVESFSGEEEKWFETDNIGNFYTEAFKVIGNIYENPELLEVDE